MKEKWTLSHSPQGECGLKFCHNHSRLNFLCRHSPQGECGLKSIIRSRLFLCRVSHSPQGECGLKSKKEGTQGKDIWSLSARRVWIEISILFSYTSAPSVSLSARRVWIEIRLAPQDFSQPLSLSARRVWIEITAYGS